MCLQVLRPLMRKSGQVQEKARDLMCLWAATETRAKSQGEAIRAFKNIAGSPDLWATGSTSRRYPPSTAR